MAKLNKMYYYTSKHEKKLNCYYAVIPKEIVEQAKMEDSTIRITFKDKKIIIEKVVDENK